MGIAIVTSHRSVSLQKVSNDIRTALENHGRDVRKVLGYPTVAVSEYQDCRNVIFVMTFDPIWAKPYFCSYYLLKSDGWNCVFYTTIEGRPKRIIGDNWIYRECEFIANSEYTKKALGRAGAKILDIIYHGIDTRKYGRFKFMRKTMRNEIGLSDNDFMVLYIAGAYRRKGHDMFRSVIQYVGKKDSSIKFVVLTQPEAVQYYSDLENCIVSDEFGKLSEDKILGLYHACDLYAHAALSEGFGLPVLEALACGKPVVHADYKPLSEITTKKISYRCKVAGTSYWAGDATEHTGIDYELHFYDPNEFGDLILQAKDELMKERNEKTRLCVYRARQFDIHKTYKKFLKYIR